MPDPSTPIRHAGAKRLAMLVALCVIAAGCRSLSYDEPDAPPAPPASPSVKSTAADTTGGWSVHANAARDALRTGDLDTAEAEFMACLQATEAFDPRDVRRLTSLAIPSRLAERRQAAGEYAEAARIMDAVLAEAQGGVPFPVDAWSHAIQTRIEVDRLQQGPEAEIEMAQLIAEIHLGPIGEATVAEVALRQQVGRVLAAHGEAEAAAHQLGWAARAAEPMLRLPLDDRLGLLYEAADTSLAAGDPTTADFLLREAVELAKKSAPRSPSAAAALNQRAWFLLEQDRAHAALPLLEQAREIVDAGATPPALRAAILDTLALALQHADRLEEASRVLDEALAARAEATPEEQAMLSELDDHRAALDRDLSVAPQNAPPAEPAAEATAAAEGGS